MIQFFLRLLSNIFSMDLNDILFGTEKDKVIRASASTYNPQDLTRLGLEITLNLSNKKVRSVGNPPVFPEIVVWRPDYQGSNTGQAVIVEEIETIGTLIYPRINDWRILSSLTGVRFNLIVPAVQLTNVQQILTANNLQNIKLQTWSFDTNTGRYMFNIIKNR